MPKSETFDLRRCPCWPGPYSRRLTGLLGRPKTFSPMRRSSLYLALERFDMFHSNSRLGHFPEPHRVDVKPTRDHRFTGSAGSIAKGRPYGRGAGRSSFEAYSGFPRRMAGPLALRLLLSSLRSAALSLSCPLRSRDVGTADGAATAATNVVAASSAQPRTGSQRLSPGLRDSTRTGAAALLAPLVST